MTDGVAKLRLAVRVLKGNLTFVVVWIKIEEKSHSSSSSLNPSSAGPPKKKAKSQAVACSLDPSKNGLHHLHHHHPHTHPSQDPNNDAVFDPSSMSLDEDLYPNDPSSRGIAANLSPKKGQPPQPSTKKLVIKLVKGLERTLQIVRDEEV